MRATKNLLAVSANTAETSINTAVELDTSLLVGEGDILNLSPRRETNADEANGREEADLIYDLGATAEASINFLRAQPQHYAFLLGYGLGFCDSSALGSGYSHQISPIQGDLDYERPQPCFTAAQRLGDTVVKRRFSSFFVDSVTASFNKDEFCKLSAGLKGTGKMDKSVTTETISAAANATAISLAANGVAGDDSAARVDAIHQITVELTPGVQTEVEYSSVSGDAPAIILITSPAAVEDIKTYTILYAPTAAAWQSFPARVTESPLKVCGMTLTVGGTWNGSVFQGGRLLTSEINSVDYSLVNGLEISFAPGGCDQHANTCSRKARVQTLKVNRDMREYILQQHLETNAVFGVQIECEGAEFASGENYGVSFVFPRCGVLTAPISANGKKLGEAGDLQILEDSTYGSALVTVVNQVSQYAL